MLEKQRFLVGSQKVMKLDLVKPVVLDSHGLGELLEQTRGTARHIDGAIVADFGNGLLSQRVIGEMLRVLRPAAKVLSGDVSGRRSGLLHMMKMDLLCPTESELRQAVHDYDASLNAAVWKLMAATRTSNVMVTLGGDGLIAFEKLSGADEARGWGARVSGEHIPAMSVHALDALGCGDALLATSTLTLLAGGSVTDAGYIGSIAAAHQAGRIGNIVVSSADLRQGLRRIDGARLAVATSGHGTHGQRLVAG